MDFDLTDEQRLIRDTAREFTDREIVERTRENARNHHFDTDLVKKVAAQGYLGAIVPPEYGGAGLDYFSYGLVVEEIGRGDSAIRTVISVQTSLVCSGIVKFGTEAQKHKYLPKLCSGEWLGCFGLTEPDTGSDAANQKTRAHKTDSGWVLNGAKMWISMGNYAKVAMIFAQTDPALGHKGIACFLVDTDQPGYSAQTIEHKMGLHASDTASISLEYVEVADEDMLGEVGDGFKIAMSNLDSGRYSVAAGCVGICRGCVEASVDYAKEREQFGRPIASFQLVQAMIADMVLKPTPRGCSCGAPAGSRTRAGRTPWRPRSPSSTRPRPPWSAQTSRSRSTAAPATSTTTPSSATSATRASRPSTRAPRRSRN